VFNVWDRIEANDFTYVVVQAVAALFPEDPPLFLARTPHGHHDTTLIEARLRRAGFAGVTVETVAKKSTVPSPRDPALDFCQGTPMRNEIEARDPTRLAPRCRLCDQPIDRREADDRRPEGRDRESKTSARLRASFGPPPNTRPSAIAAY
jgi:hypothetical protein